MKNILLFGLFVTLMSCQPSKKMINTTTVKQVDIEKYMGTWYEIARFPHSFEKDLVGVTATYTLLENGRIEVLNQGYDKSLTGELKKAKGKAKIPDPAEPGKLKVAFFWIFYADYFILELDENYQWALIGSSSEKYLWVLAREPQLPDSKLQMILNKAAERGYNLEKLILVEQQKK